MITSSLQRLAFAGGLLVAFGATPVFAQAAQGSAAPQQVTRAQISAQLDAEFKDLDANKDGKMTKAEVQSAMTRRVAEEQVQVNQQAKTVFDKIDTNHNGQISLAEFQAQGKVVLDSAKIDARVTQLDANKDGTVSADEYRNANLAQFDQADTNKDGTLSAGEASGSR